MSGIEVKISMYADDTTMFLKCPQSACTALQILDEFRKASGLELNKSKTKLMWLGSTRFSTESICGIEAVPKIKILGITHSATTDCAEKHSSSCTKN